MAKCTDCGLLDLKNKQCYANKKSLEAKDLTSEKECLHYIKTEYEDGEPMTLEQHWLFKLTEMEYKK